jgi:hypothetical protein
VIGIGNPHAGKLVPESGVVTALGTLRTGETAAPTATAD